jgi:hypothetical protein
MSAAAFELFDHFEQMADRACEAIEPYHDKYIPSGDFGHQPGKFRPCPHSARGMLLIDHMATCGGQFIDLRMGRLIFG